MTPLPVVWHFRSWDAIRRLDRAAQSARHARFGFARCLDQFVPGRNPMSGAATN